MGFQRGRRVYLVLLIALASALTAAGGTLTSDNTGACVVSPQISPYTAVYCTISDAINDSLPGDIIQATGTFTENLGIKKSLSIEGPAVINGLHTVTASDVLLSKLTFVPTGGHGITIDSNSSVLSNIEISDCTFNLMGYSGIHIGGEKPSPMLVSRVYMRRNTFNGPLSMEANPWKIGGYSSNPVGTPISDIDFEENNVNNCSIPINLHDKDITDILISNNTFRGTDGVVYVWDDGVETPTGILSYFVFIHNDVDSSNTYGVGIDPYGPVFTNANFGDGNRINYNQFSGIPGMYGFGAVSNLASGTYVLNAEHNWWGHATGPSDAGPGTGSPVSTKVDYDPWVGLQIHNKSELDCTVDTEVTVSADVKGFGIKSVWVSYRTDGAEKNQTAVKAAGDQYFSVLTGLSEGNNVTWNFYAADIYQRTYNNSWKKFYIVTKTGLTVSPIDPDGSNGWYKTEPIFTLTADDLALQIFYRWSNGIMEYISPFGLENISNIAPIESAGILTLRYFSEFGECGTEDEQNRTFQIDLRAPEIKDVQPENGSVFYNATCPEISAYLDDVYQSNSGIDNTTAKMYIDGSLVPAAVEHADTIDAVIRFSPGDDFWADIGEHTVKVMVSDNASHSSEHDWVFTTEELPAFIMTVHSPVNGTLGVRRVNLNISLTQPVSVLEFINYNSPRPRWSRLCLNCDEYGLTRKKTKTVVEGQNTLGFRATDILGNSQSENVSLFIDSRPPRIMNTLPRRNTVTNGSGFFAKYREDNLLKMELVWNGTMVFSCFDGTCEGDVDLKAYDNTTIVYYFNATDPVRSVQSRLTQVHVDTKPPELTVVSPEVDSYSRRVPFNISVSEEVTLEYYENGRWRRLCSRCDGYGDDRSRYKYFRNGPHELVIRATDRAGNYDLHEVMFDVGFFFT